MVATNSSRPASGVSDPSDESSMCPTGSSIPRLIFSLLGRMYTPGMTLAFGSTRERCHLAYLNVREAPRDGGYRWVS